MNLHLKKKRNHYISLLHSKNVVIAYGSEDEEEEPKQTVPNVYDNPIGHATSVVNESDAAAMATLGASISGGLKGATAAAAAVAPTVSSGLPGIAATTIAAGGGFIVGGLSAGAGAYATSTAYQCAGCHIGSDGQNYTMEPKKDD